MKTDSTDLKDYVYKWTFLFYNYKNTDILHDEAKSSKNQTIFFKSYFREEICKYLGIVPRKTNIYTGS